MEPVPTYAADEPLNDRTATPHRERTNFLEGVVPVRLVLGFLFLLFGVLVLFQPALLLWVVGFGLIGIGIWVLISGRKFTRSRDQLKPADPPTWQP
jgi:hypothetical protein